MNRRQLIRSIGSVLVLETARSNCLLPQAARSASNFLANPFTLGVASGDPAQDSVLLWTRLAPEPRVPGGGVYGTPTVRWLIAADPELRHAVAHGAVTATPELGHSLHVVARGLKPGQDYWYRFTAGAWQSAVGHTRTAPPNGGMQTRTRFTFASCQHYEYGYYSAHRAMAQQDLDAVLFLGDYIYENRENKMAVRHHWIDSPRTLAEYRVHYAQYKSDPDLIANHAAHPWIVTLDDHEVENNWAGMHPQYSSEPEPDFPARRAAAFQAWYENMPLRAESLPRNGSIQIYRTLPYGQLVQFTVVDTRQFRTRQPCGDNLKPSCDARLDRDATMMGAAQEAWFAESMRSSRARWNVVANQVMISQLRVPATDGQAASSMSFNMDQWDGYPAARQRLMDTLATAKPSNPVFVSGDFHQTCVCNLQHDPNDTDSPTLAAELVGTSITSGGDGALFGPGMEEDLAANHNLLYNNDRRGYILCEATAEQMHSEVWTLDAVSHAGSSPQKAASFLSKSGTAGVSQTS